MVRKLDPPLTLNSMVENHLRSTGFYHVSRIGVIRGFYPLLAALVERWRPETHTFVLPMGEIIVILEEVAHIFSLPIDGEHSQSIAIFGRELEVSSSSKSYIKLGWVRCIRDAEPLDTKESIKRYVRWQIFCLLGSTLFTDKWSHSERTTTWLSKTAAKFRQDIDYMEEFEWRPYDGLIIPDELHGYLEVCDIVALLLSFECVERHPFGHAQPPPGVARDILLDQHCITLHGVQLHD
ncbi:hypothetical protein Ahy_A02g006354 [Arachis hypogaea]|uniref:Aminotransferase-like plant mobile domain-containing protein n=1 Tax=Arachis hypogaea TaxID=3818 RepID=A0A445E9P7_ARAHY|nr:hypothetical protein Ahy_A02g006354 [Arachis hypogaea]